MAKIEEIIRITDNVNLYRWRYHATQIHEKHLCTACAEFQERTSNILSQFRCIKLSSSHKCDKCGAVTTDYYNTHLSG